MLDKRFLLGIKSLSLVVLLSFFAWKAIWKPWNQVGHDFNNYYGSARLLVEQETSLKWYDYEWFNARLQQMGLTGGSFSQFPPATAYLLIPIQMFDIKTSFRIWLGTNFILVLVLIIVIHRITRANILNAALLLLASGFGLINNFALGQFYIFLLALIVAGYAFESKGHPLLAGIAYGIGIAIKYYPVLLILIYAINKRWKTVWTAIAVAVVIKLSEWLVFGWDMFAYYLFDTLPAHLSGRLAIQPAHSPTFQSLDALLLNWFVAKPASSSWISTPILYPFSKLLILTTLIALTVWVLQRVHRSTLAHRFPLQVALVMMAGLLMAPATATYHFVLLSFPAILICTYVPRDNYYGSLSAIVICYCLIGFLPIYPITKLDVSGFWTIIKFPRLINVAVMFFVLTTILVRMSVRVPTPQVQY